MQQMGALRDLPASAPTYRDPATGRLIAVESGNVQLGHFKPIALGGTSALANLVLQSRLLNICSADSTPAQQQRFSDVYREDGEWHGLGSSCPEWQSGHGNTDSLCEFMPFSALHLALNEEEQ
jgi:hypothetical protein